MVSRIFKGAATVVATLSVAGAASANCGADMYCGQTTSPQPISSWTGQSTPAYGGINLPGTFSPQAAYGSVNLPGTFQPSQSYSTMSSYEADSTYGTGSISQTYSDTNTYGFSGSTTSVPGLGYNESLRATNCPVNVFGAGEGRVLGCYNVVKPVPQTTYYRVVRPVIYVRYPVPVAVPYTSPCHTVTHWSRYGDWHTGGYRRGCR
ncbi:MAG: hypothetical protein ABJO36_13900 [Litorimonas sp.]